MNDMSPGSKHVVVLSGHLLAVEVVSVKRSDVTKRITSLTVKEPDGRETMIVGTTAIMRAVVRFTNRYTMETLEEIFFSKTKQ